MRALLVSLLWACGASPPAVSVGWHVDVPTKTADGRDIDDAPPSVLLLADNHTVSAGIAMGRCATLPHGEPSAIVRDTCRRNAPAGTFTTLACGDDPHVDVFACIHAVRTRHAVELWRQDVAFTVSDGVPIHLEPRPLTRLGTIPLATGWKIAQ